MTDAEASAGTGNADSTDEEAEPSKWLRVRLSTLVNVDKISKISIQRRDESFYLYIAADRQMYVPVPSLDAGAGALEALVAGETDISEYTVSRSFMQDHPESVD